MENFKELSSMPLFSGIPDETLISIAGMMKEERFAAGTTVIKEGDRADFFCVLKSGEMEVLKVINIDAGKYKTLAILREGDIFGEMAIFGKETRAADVVTTKDSTLWRLDFKDFFNVINSDQKTGLQLLKAITMILISRLKATDQELATLYEVGNIINSTRNTKDLTSAVFKQVMNDIKSAKAGFMAVWNMYNEEFDIYQSLNLPAEHQISPNDPLILNLTERMSPIIVNEISEFSKFEGKFYAGRSMLVSPMVYNDNLTGLITLINPTEKNAFTYSHMVLLSTVCAHLSSALKNLEKEQDDILRERLQTKKVYY